MRPLILICSLLIVSGGIASAQATSKPGKPAPPRGGKRFINPAGLSTSRSYTHAVSVSGGRTLYISGQVALTADGDVVGVGDFRAQVTQVFENLKIALAAADADFSDVVKLNYYVVGLDSERVQTIRNVRQAYLPAENPPASTLVGVQQLVRPDLFIEIEAIAVIDGSRK